MIASTKNDELFYDSMFSTHTMYNGYVHFYTRMVINRENKSFMTEQMTGKLFNDKPPVFFGLLYHSFGCSKIYFLDKERGFIRLRYDNRH
ncbi:hypothetical protein ACWGOQ_0010725 [Aquimarina sp. M1]